MVDVGALQEEHRPGDRAPVRRRDPGERLQRQPDRDRRRLDHGVRRSGLRPRQIPDAEDDGRTARPARV